MILNRWLENRESEGSEYSSDSSLRLFSRENLDKKLYGLSMRLDLVSMRKYGMRFKKLLETNRALALEVVKEVSGGTESFKALLDLVESAPDSG